MSESNYQERYWKELVQLRINLYYIEEHIRKSERRQKVIDIFLAITATSSIAAWTVWSQLSFVWAVIIASSQVLTVVKGFLPFRDRVKELPKLYNQLDMLFLYAMEKWFRVSEGYLNNEEIHHLHLEIKKKKADITNSSLVLTLLPVNDRFRLEAEQKAAVYFSNH